MRLDIFPHFMHSIRAEAMEHFSDRSQFVIQFGWLGKCLKRNCVPQVKENSPLSGQRNSNGHIQLHVAGKKPRAADNSFDTMGMLSPEIKSLATFQKRMGVQAFVSLECLIKAQLHTSATHAFKRSHTVFAWLVFFTRGTN